LRRADSNAAGKQKPLSASVFGALSGFATPFRRAHGKGVLGPRTFFEVALAAVRAGVALAVRRTWQMRRFVA